MIPRIIPSITSRALSSSSEKTANDYKNPAIIQIVIRNKLTLL